MVLNQESPGPIGGLGDANAWRRLDLFPRMQTTLHQQQSIARQKIHAVMFQGEAEGLAELAGAAQQTCARLLIPAARLAHEGFPFERLGRTDEMAEIRRELQVRHGVWTKVHTVVPLGRVQHIDISQGPLERAFAVCRLVVHTAGTMHSQVVLPGLARATAEGMRDEIRSRIRQEEP